MFAPSLPALTQLLCGGMLLRRLLAQLLLGRQEKIRRSSPAPFRGQGKNLRGTNLRGAIQTRKIRQKWKNMPRKNTPELLTRSCVLWYNIIIMGEYYYIKKEYKKKTRQFLQLLRLLFCLIQRCLCQLICI